MEKHLGVLGALFVGLGILGLMGITAVLVIFFLGSAILGGISAQEADFPRQLVLLPAGFGVFIAVLIAVATVPSFLAGYGLLRRRSWAKSASLVAGVLNLPGLPVGTAVGIYAIWVFLQEDTDRFLHPAPR
jgi:hypothetical protein